MYPRQEYQVYNNQYPNGCYHSFENGIQYTQETAPPWSSQSQPLQHKMVYPTENYSQANNSR
jgi:hypothetical protein